MANSTSPLKVIEVVDAAEAIATEDSKKFQFGASFAELKQKISDYLVKDTPRTSEADLLLEQIRSLHEQIANIDVLLDLETDELLIEAAIYERKALSCRYSYYLQQARKTGLRGLAMTAL